MEFKLPPFKPFPFKTAEEAHDTLVNRRVAVVNPTGGKVYAVTGFKASVSGNLGVDMAEQSRRYFKPDGSRTPGNSIWRNAYLVTLDGDIELTDEDDTEAPPTQQPTTLIRSSDLAGIERAKQPPASAVTKLAARPWQPEDNLLIVGNMDPAAYRWGRQ